MSYEIKNYKEEYLEKQSEIGTAVFKKWKGQVQSSVDQLKEAYSGENFDPETKFYAFQGNEMVGFLTASVQAQEEDKPLTARMEFPIVLEGHEGVSEQLLENALSTLKDKGVASVLSRAGPNWGSTKQFVSEFGYEEANVISRISEFNPDDISIDADTSNVAQFELERDLEATIATFAEFFEIEDEKQLDNLRDQFRTLEDQVHTIHSQSMIREGDKIVARQLMYSPKSDPKSVLLGQVVALGDNAEKNTRKVMAKNLAIARENRLNNMVFSLFGGLIEQEEKFTNMGFSFKESLSMYKKNLNS